MHKITKFLTFAGLAFGLATCASADTTWNLDDVTFSDGATATGFFTIDSTFDALTNWSVDVTGSSVGADFDYTTGDSNFFDISPTFVAIGDFTFPNDNFVLVIPVSAMTNAGGTIALTTGGSGLDCSSGPCGELVTGSITTNSLTPTPEPTTIPLLAGGAILMGFVLRRKLVRAN